MKKKNKYTNRLIIPEKRLNQPSPVTLYVQIQQGIQIFELLIIKTRKSKEWIDKLSTNISSLPVYKAPLIAFINWQVADGCLK